MTAYTLKLLPNKRFFGKPTRWRLCPGPSLMLWSKAVYHALHQNITNPFNPTTTIGYQVAGTGAQASGTGQVKSTVYDLLSREVAALVNEKQAPVKLQGAVR